MSNSEETGSDAGRVAASSKRERALILIVEDQEDNRMIMQRTLRNYELAEVTDGAAAVESARQLMPSVILMDVSLPIMDGLEATRTLKSDPATEHIPIVLVTAHAMKGNREEALSTGADEYLTKPFSPSQLRELVARFA